MLHLPYYILRYSALQQLKRRCRDKRALILTFDDGPGGRLTPALVQLLAQHNARATFFLLGMRIEGNESVVDETARAGHEIGVHSFAHHHAWRVDGKTASKDVAEGYDAASRWVPSNGLFRPPHGKLSYASWREVKRRQAPICWWTIDSGDTWPELPAIERICEQVRQDRGGVLLFHDFDRGEDRETFVLGCVDAVLHAAARDGIQPLVMSEVMQS